MRIGTAPRRDVFEDETRQAQNLPGPGGYIEDTSTLSRKGFIIGERRDQKIEDKPGPGEYQYDGDDLAY